MLSESTVRPRWHPLANAACLPAVGALFYRIAAGQGIAVLDQR